VIIFYLFWVAIFVILVSWEQYSIAASIHPLMFQDSPWGPMATSAKGSPVEAKSPDRLGGPSADLVWS
jgi:hypothetical protein